MTDYIRLFKRYMVLSAMNLIEYRVSFYLRIVGFIFLVFFNILFWDVIFSGISSFNGWSFGGVMVLQGMVAFYISLFWIFLRGSADISERVIDGGFNQFLARPMNVLVSTVLSEINLGALDFGLTGIIYFIVAANTGTQIALLPLLVSFIMVSLAAIIFAMIIMTLGSLAFWIGRFDVSEFIHSIMNSFSDYPIHIYPATLQFFLTLVIPLGFIQTFPTQVATSNVALSQAFYWILIELALLAFWYFILNFVFSKGIKRYEGHGV